jgi:hypothetical protein
MSVIVIVVIPEKAFHRDVSTILKFNYGFFVSSAWFSIILALERASTMTYALPSQ